VHRRRHAVRIDEPLIPDLATRAVHAAPHVCGDLCPGFDALWPPEAQATLLCCSTAVGYAKSAENTPSCGWLGRGCTAVERRAETS
jgi:hypothetical protein